LLLVVEVEEIQQPILTLAVVVVVLAA